MTGSPTTPTLTPDVLDATALAAALDAARITGEVATPRENNLAHMTRFLASEDGFHFGVELVRDWDLEQVFDLMVERVGISADRSHEEGQDTISAQLCIAAARRYASVLGEVVSAGGRILFASGHPAGMMPVYQDLAALAEAAGAQVLTLPSDTPNAPGGGDVRFVGRVALWHQHGGLPHTHAPEPMSALLDRLDAEGSGVDLVVADHGFAGHSGSRGVRTIGVADCNDPALFVAEVQGQVEAVVPLDDDVAPGLYAPLTRFIAHHAGLLG